MIVMAYFPARQQLKRTELRPESHSLSRRTPLVWLILLTLWGAGVSLSRAQEGNLASNFATVPLTTLSKQVEEVSLILTVTNRRGRFVKDLNPSDLTILDNGQPPERILYFQTQTDLPLRVALVVDASDSITNRFKFEKKAASVFLRRMMRPGTDLALVMGFNQDVRIWQSTSGDSERLSHGLERITAGGETAIYDAVAAACRQLSNIKDNQPSRRAIILITDGEDNRSHISLEQAVDAALRAETVVYVLSTNLLQMSLDKDEGEMAMRQLSEATGGHLLRAESERDVSRAFSTIAKELRSQYAIGYKPASSGPDGLFHRLTVLGPKKFRIFHRLGYFAK